MTNSRRTKRNINKELMFGKIMPSYTTSTYNEYTATLNQMAEEYSQKNIKESNTFKIKDKIMPAVEERPLVKETPSAPYRAANSPTQTFSVLESAQQLQQTAVQPPPLPKVKVDDDKPKYINITEQVLYSKLENMIAMFKCCNCEKCRQAVMLQVLNNVKPEYVFKKPSEVKKLINESNYVDINQPIIRAILDTKANPPHKK